MDDARSGSAGGVAGARAPGGVDLDRLISMFREGLCEGQIKCKVRNVESGCWCTGAADALTSLRAAEALLRECAEVLEPFAAFVIHDTETDFAIIAVRGRPGKRITVGDFRRARTLLARIREKGNG
jgi:hypothetical protein